MVQEYIRSLCLGRVMVPQCVFSFCLFCCFTSQVNSYGHGGTVSSPKHTFSWTSLNEQLTSTWALDGDYVNYFGVIISTNIMMLRNTS